jgi:hypothetical protein
MLEHLRRLQNTASAWFDLSVVTDATTLPTRTKGFKLGKLAGMALPFAAGAVLHVSHVKRP